MPIYEYECKSCGHHMEIIQKFSDGPLTDCPHCQKAELAKVLSAPAFHLKGSDWYKTDYKKTQPACPNSSDSQAAGSCGAGACQTQGAESA